MAEVVKKCDEWGKWIDEEYIDGVNDQTEGTDHIDIKPGTGVRGAS